ncbi:DUF6233 domain-containing protein [Streptomyces sp. NPDC046465]|uniref:DUF6233 domain-containing protein n=1 Tax=Streptomyces sp. NPDC046465 TaxID=3155810 RepID=UPI0033E7EAB7
MNDPAPPSRLDMLRFLERVQRGNLERTRGWIAAEERREAERLQGERARPPAPDWIIERGIGQGGPPIEVHRGDCHAAGKRRRAVTEGEARQALADGIRACTHCRPRDELGTPE